MQNRPHLGDIKALQGKRAEIIATNLMDCFGSLNTYGADPSSLESRVRTFSRVLEGYSPERIHNAFSDYFATGKGLPEPSDIKYILDAGRPSSDPAHKVFDRTKDPVHPCYIDLMDDDKTRIDQALQSAYSVLQGDEGRKAKDRKGIDTKHFDSMSAEAKQVVIDSVQKSISNLRKAQGDSTEIS